MTAAAPPIVLRPPRKEEEAFIYAGWIRSCLSYPPARVWSDDRHRLHTKYLDSGWADTLKRRVAWHLLDTVVATAEGAPNALIGFISATPRVVHFVYVEGPFRRRGVARRMVALVAPGAIAYSHWTPAAAALFPTLEWNEYSLEDRP